MRANVEFRVYTGGGGGERGERGFPDPLSPYFLLPLPMGHSVCRRVSRAGATCSRPLDGTCGLIQMRDIVLARAVLVLFFSFHVFFLRFMLYLFNPPWHAYCLYPFVRFSDFSFVKVVRVSSRNPRKFLHFKRDKYIRALKRRRERGKFLSAKNTSNANFLSH